MRLPQRRPATLSNNTLLTFITDGKFLNYTVKSYVGVLLCV